LDRAEDLMMKGFYVTITVTDMARYVHPEVRDLLEGQVEKDPVQLALVVEDGSEMEVHEQIEQIGFRSSAYYLPVWFSSRFPSIR